MICNWTSNSAKNPNYIFVQENRVYNSNWQGIQTWNEHHILISGNEFYNNGSSGIQVENGTKFYIVENNYTHDNSLKNETETGIWIDDAYRGFVRNNISTRNEIGLTIGKSNHCVARNNLIYKNNRNTNDTCGIMVAQYEGVVNNYTYIVNNTIYANGNGSLGEHGNITIGIFGEKVTRVTMKNNIIASSLMENELYVNCRYYTSNNNLFYDENKININYQGTGMQFLDYIIKSRQDKKSIVKLPEFQNLENNDFNLTAGSPAINNGTFMTLTTNEGSGNKITVKDAKYFTDGFDIGEPDVIIIGNNEPVKIVSVNYATNTIEVENNINWNINEEVSYLYYGSGPDIGAFEK